MGTLLSLAQEPEGFTNGRRLLAACEEFQLFELGKPGGKRIVEYAPDVALALEKALHGCNEAGGAELMKERVHLAQALEKLSAFSQQDLSDELLHGAVPVARAIA